MLSALDAALEAASTAPRAGAFQPKVKPRARKGGGPAGPSASAGQAGTSASQSAPAAPPVTATRKPAQPPPRPAKAVPKASPRVLATPADRAQLSGSEVPAVTSTQAPGQGQRAGPRVSALSSSGRARPTSSSLTAGNVIEEAQPPLEREPSSFHDLSCIASPESADRDELLAHEGAPQTEELLPANDSAPHQTARGPGPVPIWSGVEEGTLSQHALDFQLTLTPASQVVDPSQPLLTSPRSALTSPASPLTSALSPPLSHPLALESAPLYEDPSSPEAPYLLPAEAATNQHAPAGETLDTAEPSSRDVLAPGQTVDVPGAVPNELSGAPAVKRRRLGKGKALAGSEGQGTESEAAGAAGEGRKLMKKPGRRTAGGLGSDEGPAGSEERSPSMADASPAGSDEPDVGTVPGSSPTGTGTAPLGTSGMPESLPAGRVRKKRQKGGEGNGVVGDAARRRQGAGATQATANGIAPGVMAASETGLPVAPDDGAGMDATNHVIPANGGSRQKRLRAASTASEASRAATPAVENFASGSTSANEAVPLGLPRSQGSFPAAAEANGVAPAGTASEAGPSLAAPRRRKAGGKQVAASQGLPAKKRKIPHATRRGRRLIRDPLLDDENVDLAQLTLRNLIRRVEKAENKKMREELQKKRDQGGDAGTNESARDRRPVEEREAAGPSLAPQVQVVNGRIVINQGSLSAPSHVREDTESYRRVEDAAALNSRSYSNWNSPDKWKPEETELFYQALRQFGSDFALIGQLFPGRTRRQLKNKYLKEDRHNKDRVDAALNHRCEDHTHYMELMRTLNEGKGGEEGWTDAMAEANQGEGETGDAAGDGATVLGEVDATGGSEREVNEPLEDWSEGWAATQPARTASKLNPRRAPKRTGGMAGANQDLADDITADVIEADITGDIITDEDGVSDVVGDDNPSLDVDEEGVSIGEHGGDHLAEEDDEEEDEEEEDEDVVGDGEALDGEPPDGRFSSWPPGTGARALAVRALSKKGGGRDAASRASQGSQNVTGQSPLGGYGETGGDEGEADPLGGYGSMGSGNPLGSYGDEEASGDPLGGYGDFGGGNPLGAY